MVQKLEKIQKPGFGKAINAEIANVTERVLLTLARTEK